MPFEEILISKLNWVKHWFTCTWLFCWKKVTVSIYWYQLIHYLIVILQWYEEISLHLNSIVLNIQTKDWSICYLLSMNVLSWRGYVKFDPLKVLYTIISSAYDSLVQVCLLQTASLLHVWLGYTCCFLLTAQAQGVVNEGVDRAVAEGEGGRMEGDLSCRSSLGR